MQWLEITVKTRSESIQLVADRLTAVGFDSFIIDDREDFQQFLRDNQQYWDYVDEDLASRMADLSQIRLYVEDGPEAPETVDTIRRHMNDLKCRYGDGVLGGLELQISGIQEEDWENNWKQYYQPLPIGQKLLVVPQWLSPENEDGRIPVILDPGMIFGTGAHASTQMCMRALEKSVSGQESVLDLGSGSGILSITALLLGAGHAVGVDIDPKAEDIARENAAMNHLLSDRFTAVTGDVIADGQMMEKLGKESYDIVLANIVADVIIPLSRVVPAFLKEGGIFICSGILDVRLDEVKSALEKSGLRVTEEERQEDWCRLTARVR